MQPLLITHTVYRVTLQTGKEGRFVKRDEKKRVKMTDDKGFFGLSVGYDVVSHEEGRIRHITTRFRPLHLQEIYPRTAGPNS